MNFNLLLNFIISIILINLSMFTTIKIKDVLCILIILMIKEKLKLMEVIGIYKEVLKLLSKKLEIILLNFSTLLLNNLMLKTNIIRLFKLN